MSLPPPGLGPAGAGSTGPPSTAQGAGQGAAGAMSPLRTGPPGFPPGFGALGSPTGRGGMSGTGAGTGGGSSISKAQINVLLTTFNEASFEKQSNDIRTLASTEGPDVYHHFLRRAATVAAPVLQLLVEHYTQYRDEPNAPPPQIPTIGQAALVWKLLVVEALRAARDVTLAPHFVNVMLSPSQSTPLPLPSIAIFGLSTPFLFSISAFTLCAPSIFPPSHAQYEAISSVFRSTLVPAMELLRTQGQPFWRVAFVPNQEAHNDNLTPQEARTLILALYPRSATSDTKSSPQPVTSTNPTPTHPTFLSSYERQSFLASIAIHFGSPAVILQTVSALSPGGPPRSAEAVPLEEMLFELADLTQDTAIVDAVIRRWWGPYLLESTASDREDRLLEEAGETLRGLCAGAQQRRQVDWHGIVLAMTAFDGLDGAKLISSFDTPNSLLAHPASLGLLSALLTDPPQSPVPSISGLLPANPEKPSWNNLLSLLAVIHPLANQPTAVPLFDARNQDPPSPSAFRRIIDPPTSDSGMSRTARMQAKSTQEAGILNALGLIQVLVEAYRVADSDAATEESAEIGRRATEMMEGIKHVAPDLLLIALEKLPKPLPDAVAAHHRDIMAVYLNKPASEIASSQIVFHSLYHLDPHNLLNELEEFYNDNELKVYRVLEIAEELRILDKILDMSNLHFVLDFAALAAAKDKLDLENWLAAAVSAKGDEYLQGIFDFVEYKVRVEMEQRLLPESSPSPTLALSASIYSIFIRVIRNAENLSQEDISRFKHLRTDILIIHPALLNVRPGSKEEQGFTVANFDPATTEYVNNMFTSMYEGKPSLDEMVIELKRMQKSKTPGEIDAFDCALHTLFDEFKFLKTYPEHHLIVTGILFGAIIDERLIKDQPAFVATRYVLDACKTSPQEKVYQFGVNALGVLRGSLVDFPGLCRSLLEIPALHQTHPTLINEIVSALAERDDINRQGGVKLAFPALRLPILIEEGDDEFREPEDSKRDRFMFIVNQISPGNLDQMIKRLQDIFEAEHSRWFAHYFIDVRVALEANHHATYWKMIEALDSALLEKHVLWETYRKARDLLNNDQTPKSAVDRTSLKTIALWLGRITLARNKPVRLQDLAVKDLLIQGFDNDRLPIAMPFVCNLLSFCADSTIFHPPNPWLMGVLELLSEMYKFGNLKIQSKFEIEVLFNRLKLQVDSVQPCNLLRSHVPPPEPQKALANRLQLDLDRALMSAEEAQERLEQPFNEAQKMQAAQNEQHAQAIHEAFTQRVDELMKELPQYLVFSSEYPVFTAPTLQRIVLHSIDRAVRDIVHPVVDRSIAIAGISTRDLIQKDFAMEGDANKLRHAAHSMVQRLAGSLAVNTCREPLRNAMTNNIRAMLIQNGYTDDNLPQNQIEGVVTENLEVACQVIKKGAEERSTKDIDMNLGSHYAARRAYVNGARTAPFFDQANFGPAVPPNSLPDPLRLQAGGLTQTQLRVYEDFSDYAQRLPATNGEYGYEHQAQADLNLNLKRGPSPSISSLPAFQDERAPSPHPPAAMSPQVAFQKFAELAADIERFIAHSQLPSIAAIPADSDVHGLVNNILQLADRSANREQSTLSISQKVVQMLYKSQSQFGREVYVALLQRLCALSRKVEKEVKAWFLHVDDPRKFNVPVTSTLIRGQFLDVPQLDTQLANVIDARAQTPEIVDYVADLIRECIFGERPMLPRTSFASCLKALLQAQEHGASTRSSDALLSELRNTGRPPSAAPAAPNGTDKPVIDSKLKDRLAHYFIEWVKVHSNAKSIDNAFGPYIVWIQKEGILNGEDISSAFYRTAVNCAVDIDSGGMETGSNFFATDALATLIVLIVKNYGDNSKPSREWSGRAVYYFNKLVTIMAYSLVQRQLEHGPFSQRPWTRLFTSLLSQLKGLEQKYPDLYIGCLKSFANAVMGISQPTFAPRFAYGWMSILSHRLFMGKLLAAPREEGWADYHRCLQWHFRFISPLFKAQELSPSGRTILQATLRLLIVLLHDFPDFLVEHYHTLAANVPLHCIQMRNIILSAFPSSEAPLPSCYDRLPSLLGRMQHFPTVRSDYMSALSTGGLRAAIDQYVRSRQPEASALVTEIKNRVVIKQVGTDGEPLVVYNTTLLHAVVFYLGTTAVGRFYQRMGRVDFESKMEEVRLLGELATSLDAEGQYYMISIIADQLRYPSAHTLFFIHLLLYLFSASQGSQSGVPERIGRVLLERICGARPHPWGMVVTFIELLENEAHGFWTADFLRDEEGPEIRQVFEKCHKGIIEAAAVETREAGQGL